MPCIHSFHTVLRQCSFVPLNRNADVVKKARSITLLYKNSRSDSNILVSCRSNAGDPPQLQAHNLHSAAVVST